MRVIFNDVNNRVSCNCEGRGAQREIIYYYYYYYIFIGEPSGQLKYPKKKKKYLRATLVVGAS